jgi:hypothetical protein
VPTFFIQTSNATGIISYKLEAVPLPFMIRYISAILLLCAFAIQSFNGVFVVVSYYANKSSYSKDCVNKFRPQLHCEGKCVMMKKMIEAEKKDQQAPEPKMQIKNDVFTSDNITSVFVEPGVSANENLFSILPDKSSSGFLQSIFHPPAVC